MGKEIQQSVKIDDTTEVGMEAMCDDKHFASFFYRFTYDNETACSFISIKMISNK